MCSLATRNHLVIISAHTRNHLVITSAQLMCAMLNYVKENSFYVVANKNMPGMQSVQIHHIIIIGMC